MAVFAGDIKVDPTLRANIGGNNSVGSRAQTSIGDTYKKLMDSLGADAKARGVRGAPSTYAPSRLATGEGESQAVLQTGLESVLGNTAYTNYKADRGYNENEALARQIGALNKPNTLEEVLGALGLAGKVGGAVYGASTPRAGQTYGALPTMALGNRNSYGADQELF